MDFLAEVEKKLDLPPGEKAQVMRELRSHYEELKGELVASGMDAHDAEQEASRRLGDPADVASRMQAIHCRATWKTALLTALPLAAMMIVRLAKFPLGLLIFGNHASKSAVYAYHMPLLVVTALFGAIFLTGSIRELIRNRRPIWLATWLAVGFRELGSATYGLHELMKYMAGQRTPQVGVLPSVVLWILATGVFAMIIFRRSTKWFLILGGWTVLAEVVYILVPWASFRMGWSIALSVLADAPLVMAIALGLFARHPYGNTAQASLFLFAFSAAGTSLFATQYLEWHVVVANALPPMVIVATVLAYARSAMWRQKLVILAGGIVVAHLSTVLVTVWSPLQADLSRVAFYMTQTTIQILFILFWVILVPLLFERRQAAKLELVR